MSKILWVNAPHFNKSQGVYKYSVVIIDLIKSRLDGDIKELYWKGRKGIWRYFWEFLVLPVIISSKSITHSKVVLYQESMIYLILFSFFFKDRVVIIHHVPDMQGSGTLLSRLKIIYLKLNFLILKLPIKYKIIVPTSSTMNHLISSVGIARENVFVIPNLFDFSIKPSDKVNKVNTTNSIKVLNVGSDEPRKALKTIIKAIAKLNELGEKKYTIIRAGKIVDLKSHQSTLDLAKELSVELLYFDEPTDIEIIDLYLDSDIYVSASEHEGFGRTVIEAQLANLPVCATSIPAHKEVLQDSASFFSVGNHEQLVQCILKISDNDFKQNLIQKGVVNSSRYLPMNSEKVIKKVFFDER